MSCARLRDRLLRGESDRQIDLHLADCPECARFAARVRVARAALGRRAHPADLAPHPAFARRVVARLPGSAEVMGRLALRALPAALVLALALAWVGLDQAPLPAATLLSDEPTSAALLTWSAFAPAPAPPAPPATAAEAPR